VLFTWQGNPVEGRSLVLEGTSLVLEGNPVGGKNQAEDMHHPGGNLEQVEGMHRPGGIQLADNLDQEEVDSHHKAAHMLVVVHIQQEAA
jgi:hypothetical protein